MKKYLILVISYTLIYAGVDIIDIYYYFDPLGISIHRPEMDHSETIILAEHSPPTKDGSFNFREIIFYIHGDTAKNQKFIRKSSRSKKRRPSINNKPRPYFSQYGHWSSLHDSMFSYIQVRDEEWVGRQYSLVEAIITGVKTNGKILSKEQRLINQEDIYFNPHLIKYFSSISIAPEIDDKYYVIYINDQGNEAVLSSDDIFNSNSNIVYDIYTWRGDSIKTINPLLKDPIDIQINMGNEHYRDALMTVYSGEDTEKDIYYFCSIDDINDDMAIPILMQSDSIFKYNQYAPMFSFDGTYISYITQNKNNEFELRVVKRPSYNRISDCVEHEFEGIHSFSLNEHKIVDNILTYEDFGIDPFRFTSYAWHPEENILFYITNVESEDIIRYYDIDNDKKGLIETGTLSNRYISVSPQGNYLLFTFSGYKNNSFHFINCDNNDMQTNVNCCGNESTGHKIGVASIAIQ